jgi:hypothetical protein
MSDQSRDDDDSDSLAARAAKAARAELRGDRAGMLGAKGPSQSSRLERERRVPAHWTPLFVMERLEEAFRTLRKLPIHAGPRGYVNSMPHHPYDRADLNAQLETQELERTARLRNRARISPSPAEIARMEEALRWPAAYLSGVEFHHLARAVNLGAMWAAAKVNVAKGLRRIKATRRVFDARRWQGLLIITRELIRRCVPIR